MIRCGKAEERRVWVGGIALRVLPFAAVDIELGVSSAHMEHSKGPDSQAEPSELPKTVSITWLLTHVPIGAWLTLGGILIAAFTIGATVGKSPLFTDKSTAPPLSESGLIDPAAVQVQKLVEAHNSRLDGLTQAYLKHEDEAANLLYSSDQQRHLDAASHIRAAIEAERRSFREHLASIRRPAADSKP